MENATRYALEAVILGLRRAGAINDHAMTVVVDELRDAARRSSEELDDRGSVQIERLASALSSESGGSPSALSRDGMDTPGTRLSVREPGAARATRAVSFLGITIDAFLPLRSRYRANR